MRVRHILECSLSTAADVCANIPARAHFDMVAVYRSDRRPPFLPPSHCRSGHRRVAMLSAELSTYLVFLAAKTVNDRNDKK